MRLECTDRSEQLPKKPYKTVFQTTSCQALQKTAEFLCCGEVATVDSRAEPEMGEKGRAKCGPIITTKIIALIIIVRRIVTLQIMVKQACNQSAIGNK